MSRENKLMEGLHGTVALVGSGEFLEPIEPLDRELLARVRDEARVVVLPTASAPDGPGVPEHWAQLGIKHFARLGVAVEAVMVLTREDAESGHLASKIAQATVVYLSGGKPQFLLETLRGSACWGAIAGVFEAGGVVVGCSAGAMVLAGHLLAFPGMRRSVPALGLAPGIAVIPHFDEIPGWITGVMRRAPSGVTVVGVDGSTGLVGSHEQGWTVSGRGTVTVFEGKQRQQYHSGESVPLAVPPITPIS
jgi:cyanophycinase